MLLGTGFHLGGNELKNLNSAHYVLDINQGTTPILLGYGGKQ